METADELIQRISPHYAVIHSKDHLDSRHRIGDHVCITYSVGTGRVRQVYEKNRSEELLVESPGCIPEATDPGYIGGYYWPPSIAGFAGLLVTNVLATQCVAHHFEYQEHSPSYSNSAAYTFTPLINGSSGFCVSAIPPT